METLADGAFRTILADPPWLRTEDAKPSHLQEFYRDLLECLSTPLLQRHVDVVYHKPNIAHGVAKLWNDSVRAHRQSPLVATWAMFLLFQSCVGFWQAGKFDSCESTTPPKPLKLGVYPCWSQIERKAKPLGLAFRPSIYLSGKTLLCPAPIVDDQSLFAFNTPVCHVMFCAFLPHAKSIEWQSLMANLTLFQINIKTYSFRDRPCPAMVSDDRWQGGQPSLFKGRPAGPLSLFNPWP